MSFFRSLSILSLTCASLYVSAAPIVSSTLTGSPGAYIIDFKIENTLGGTNEIYLFGVASGVLLSAPSGWEDFGTINPSDIGGPNQNYRYWLNPTFGKSGNRIQPGKILAGFRVGFENLPQSVDYEVAALGFGYAGNDYLNTWFNPVFVGTASIKPVPEPTSAVALTFGIYAIYRRRKI